MIRARSIARSRPRAWLVAFTAILSAASGMPAAAPGQELGEGSRGFSYGEASRLGLYTIDTIPAGVRLVLTGRNRLAGPSPILVSGDLRQEYRVEASERGYERVRGRLILPGAGQPLELQGSRGAIGPRQLTQALVWPGVAQRLSHDNLRGAAFFTAASLSVGATVASHRSLHASDAAAATARRRATSATTVAERVNAEIDVVVKVARSNQASRARRHWGLVTAAVWGLSIADYLLLSPQLGDAQVGLTDVTLTLRPASRARAALRSVIPGQGQLYAGRKGAAALSILSALLAGYGLLAAEHAYDEAADRVAGLGALYNDPQADPETLEILRPAVEDEVRRAESRRDTRNILLGVAAGVWALGILDAYLATPTATPAGADEFTVAPRLSVTPDGGAAAAVRIGF